MENKVQIVKITGTSNSAKTSTSAKITKDSIVLSNDPTKSCKTFCCCCDQVITVSGMRKHIKSRHHMTLTEYKELYSNPRMQIIQLVFHVCAFCYKSVLLDTYTMSKHLKKFHKTSYKEYLVSNMGKPANPLQRSPQNIITKKVVEEKKDSTLVIIRCFECPKTFKQNIQLKVHKRKHSAHSI